MSESSGMTKAGTGVKLEDSNISAYGSKEHKDAKLNAAKMEKAWTGAGQQVGTEIWRIEKFQVVPWPKTKYGSFFSGDAYIVLNTYKIPDSDAFRFNVHFWLGKTSSQDEQGTAAYKTVELDDLLGDTPVQFREVQGSESTEFMDIFGGKIVTMDGGVASGFNNVKPKDYKPRLLQMKGRRKKVHVSEVPMNISSMNHGDVFLLDAGLVLYQWNGVSSNPDEKVKCIEIHKAISEDRNGRVKLHVVDGIEDNKEFWALLGVNSTPKFEDIAAASTDDIPVPEYPKRLFKLSDSSGNLEMTLVGEGKNKILKSKLDMTDVFLLDVGTRIDVWIGKKASKQERSQGIQFGVAYLKQQGRPISTPVVRVVQGREPESFWDEFDG